MTLAILSSSGNIPSWSDKLQMYANGWDIYGEDIFSNMADMSSYPDALSFKEIMIWLISFWATGSWKIDCSILLPIKLSGSFFTCGIALASVGPILTKKSLNLSQITCLFSVIVPSLSLNFVWLSRLLFLLNYTFYDAPWFLKIIFIFHQKILIVHFLCCFK